MGLLSLTAGSPDLNPTQLGYLEALWASQGWSLSDRKAPRRAPTGFDRWRRSLGNRL